MSIVETSNKKMLFELLKSIGTDNNFVVNDNELIDFINKKCNYFHVNRYEFDFGSNLNAVNKKIVEDGYNFIMSKQVRQNVPEVRNEQLSKREMFDVGLANKEAQFKNLIDPKKPKEIDFTDGSEDFPIKNLDVIMNQTLADRERELNSITKKYSNQDQMKAQKWLNREDETPKIKIERNSNITLKNQIVVKPKKKVTFEVDEKKKDNNLIGFLSKLKQKPIVEDNNIINKLDIIIKNQNEILKLLKKS